MPQALAVRPHKNSRALPLGRLTVVVEARTKHNHDGRHRLRYWAVLARSPEALAEFDAELQRFMREVSKRFRRPQDLKRQAAKDAARAAADVVA